MSAFAPRIGGGMAKTTLNNTITMASMEGVDLVDDGIFDRQDQLFHLPVVSELR